MDKKFNFSKRAIEVMRVGKILDEKETPEQMVERVLDAIFSVERDVFHINEIESNKMRNKFENYIAQKAVILGSPTLTNAGRKNHEDRSLSSCIAVPIDLRKDFSQIKKSVLPYYEHNMGSGFNFDEVDDPVKMLHLLNNLAIQEAATQKYDRYIGNMGILSINHPKIEEFIDAKLNRKKFWHFNISININDQFIALVKNKLGFTLKNGRRVHARRLWDKIIKNAHACGDPGLIFLNRMNESNPLKSLGEYTTTAPCAEVGLAPGESCQFGYINLARFFEKNFINFEKLKDGVLILTRVLDDALEYSIARYPTKISREIMKAKRKIGIGVCGFADLLSKMEVKYGSQKSHTLLRELLIFINYYSKLASHELAKSRGSFTGYKISDYNSNNYLGKKYGHVNTKKIIREDWINLGNMIYKSGFLRHVSTMALPPSGRSALILDASNSIEPYFSEALQINPIKHLEIVQVAAECVDESISKTINLHEKTSEAKISQLYMMAYEKNLKGIAIFRNKSLERQAIKL